MIEENDEMFGEDAVIPEVKPKKRRGKAKKRQNKRVVPAMVQAPVAEEPKPEYLPEATFTPEEEEVLQTEAMPKPQEVVATPVEAPEPEVKKKIVWKDVQDFILTVLNKSMAESQGTLDEADIVEEISQPRAERMRLCVKNHQRETKQMIDIVKNKK